MLKRYIDWISKHRKLVAATLAGVILLLTPLAVSAYFASQPVNNQEIINKALVAQEYYQPTTKVAVVLTTPQGVTVNFDVVLGASRNAYEFDAKAQVNMGFVSYSLSGKAVYDRQASAFYLQVSNPQLITSAMLNGGLIDAGAAENIAQALDGAWLKLTTADLGDNQDAIKVANCVTGYLNGGLQTADVQPLLDIANRHPAANRLDKVLEPEQVRGQANYHYKVSVDDKESALMYAEIGKLNSFKSVFGSCTDAFKIFEKLNTATPADAPVPYTATSSEMWVNKQTGLLSKITEEIKTQGVTINMTEEMMYKSDYKVVIPTDNILSLKDLQKLILSPSAQQSDEFYAQPPSDTTDQQDQPNVQGGDYGLPIDGNVDLKVVH